MDPVCYSCIYYNLYVIDGVVEPWESQGPQYLARQIPIENMQLHMHAVGCGWIMVLVALGREGVSLGMIGPD